MLHARPVRHSALLMSGGFLLLALLAACGSSTSPATQEQPTATTTATETTAQPVVVVAVKSAMVAGKSTQVLGDTNGKTLYYFTADTSTQVACTGSCATLWPPLLLPSGTPAAQASLPGEFGVVNGALGRQVTYNGHPLYTYSKDATPTDATGQGVGGKWFAATPDLADSGSGSTPPGGYGY